LRNIRNHLNSEFTPSGGVQITRLQAREGYAYIKP
jgi:intracellular sulfur oxidation DsrE/DsrF family protein